MDERGGYIQQDLEIENFLFFYFVNIFSFSKEYSSKNIRTSTGI